MIVMILVIMEMVIIKLLYLKWILMKMMKIFKLKRIHIIVFNFNKKYKKKELSIINESLYIYIKNNI